MHGKRQRGFTVLEILATLAIIGISASMAVPGFTSVMRESEQAARINDLSGSIRMARSAAVTRNAEVVVCASANGKTCDGSEWAAGWLVFEDGDYDRQVSQDESVLRLASAIEWVRIDSPQFENFLVYRGDGHVMAGSTVENFGAFSICNLRGPTRHRVLNIKFTGHLQLTDASTDASKQHCG